MQAELDDTSLGELLDTNPKGGWFVDRLKEALEQEFSNISNTIRDSKIEERPTPFIHLENVFSEDFYDKVLKSVARCAPFYLDLSGSASWSGDGEHYMFCSTQIAKMLQSDNETLEAVALHELIKWAESLSAALVTKFREWIPEFAVEGDHKFKSNGYLMRDESGYGIKPHTEAFHTVITAMFYLPYDDRLSPHGTAFYVPKQPGKACFGRGQTLPLYPESEFHVAKQLPFIRNSMMAFVKTPKSWHGLPSIGTIPYSRNSLTINVNHLARGVDDGLTKKLISTQLDVPDWGR